MTKSRSEVKNYLLDTNVLLHDPKSIVNFQENNVLLPIEVIEEIDRRVGILPLIGEGRGRQGHGERARRRGGAGRARRAGQDEGQQQAGPQSPAEKSKGKEGSGRSSGHGVHLAVGSGRCRAKKAGTAIR